MSGVANLSLESISPLDLMNLSRAQKVEILQRFRATGTHNPNIIFFLATDVLSGGKSGIGATELYEIYEQVLVASLESGRLEKAKVYLDVLEKGFGKRSVRVRQLKGLCYEAEGKMEEAKKVYDFVRKENPSSDFAVKRLSAILKSEGNYREAIEVLEEQLVYTDDEEKEYTFLEIHNGNYNTFKELSNLYFLAGSIDKAIYYMEETLLADPDNFTTHCRLGELFYLKKDYSRCVIEYSQSLLLNSNPNNCRASYALWQVVNEIMKQHNSGTHKLDADKEKQTVELQEYAADTLRTMYSKSSALSALEAVLEREVKNKK